MAFDIAFAAIRRIAPLATIGGDLSSQWCGDKAHRCGALSHGDFSGPAGLMKLSGFVVRKFASADLERAFRTDYARRYAGQRRLAGAASLLLWILFARRDWWLLTRVDPGIIFHVGYLRLAGAVGMAVPICLMWGPRAFDERWVVGLLCVWMLSCWFTLLQLMELYPGGLGFPGSIPRIFTCPFHDIHIAPTSSNHGSVVSRAGRCKLSPYPFSLATDGRFHGGRWLGVPWVCVGHHVFYGRCHLHSV
ncbi:hypothetical protein [Paraburkholderia sp. 32]|uniref:hypothetical protein n=1 Tax=Paraburkholderia sp. 32 TaxID=2991057 RepID=UPI003D22E72E